MKTLALLSLCCVLATPLVARAQDEAPATGELPPAPKSAATSDAFVWRVQPEVGSRWQMRTFSRLKQIQTTPAAGAQPAQKIEMNIITRMTADYDVLARDRFGASTIRITYRELSTDSAIKVNGKSVGKAAKAAMSRALNGATFTIKQAPDGSIWNIVGLEQAQEKLLMSQNVTDPAERAMMRDLSKSMFSKDGLKKLMQGVSGGTLPTYPVRVGESWNYSTDVPAALPFRIDFTGTRTLKALDQNVASIAEQMNFGGGQMEIKVPAQGKVIVDMNDLKGSFNGTTRVERSSGLPLETTLHQNLGGQVQLQVVDPKGVLQQKVAVPIEQTGVTHMVLEPRAVKGLAE